MTISEKIKRAVEKDAAKMSKKYEVSTSVAEIFLYHGCNIGLEIAKGIVAKPEEAK